MAGKGKKFKSTKVEEPVVVVIQDPMSERQARIQEIMNNPDLSKSKKAREIDILLGLRRVKKKYNTEAERREASRQKRLDRIAKREAARAEQGVIIVRTPRPRLTEEEREAHRAMRKIRSKEAKEAKRDSFLRYLMANPEEAARLHKTQTLSKAYQPPDEQMRMF